MLSLGSPTVASINGLYITNPTIYIVGFLFL